jgi:hypothetical protein
MNPTEDPVWLYFDHQHKHILAHLRKIFEEGLNIIKGNHSFIIFRDYASMFIVVD